MVKTIKTLLPGQMGIPQQPLAACNLAMLALLFTEGVERLAAGAGLPAGSDHLNLKPTEGPR